MIQSANNFSIFQGNDRKKEGSSLQCLIPPKKAKLANHPQPPRQVSLTEIWETYAEECDPSDIVPKVLEANDNDEGDRVIGLLCGAIETLRNKKLKPDPVVYMGLLYLTKIRPSLFSNDCILHGMTSLLKREPTPPYKSKGNPVVPVLAANMLMRGYHDKKKWPEVFVKVCIIPKLIFLNNTALHQITIIILLHIHFTS